MSFIYFEALRKDVEAKNARLMRDIASLDERVQRLEHRPATECDNLGFRDPPPAALPTPEQVAETYAQSCSEHYTLDAETITMVLELVLDVVRKDRARRGVVQGIDPEHLREIVEMWRLPTSDLLCMRQVEALLAEHDAKGGGA